MTQSLSIPTALALRFPQAEIHWVTRADFSELLENHPHIHQKYFLDRKSGIKGLLQLGLKLRRQNFTHVYDAHNNMRSHILGWIICGFKKNQFLRKSQKRWKRFLLFQLHKNTYEMPFSGQRDLLEPLVAWGISKESPPPPQLFLSESVKTKMHQKKIIPWSHYISLAPSAAFALKRWPLEMWTDLISQLPEKKFVVLGGPEDHFLASLAEKFPDRVINAAGQCSLMESAVLVNESQILVANDTGLLHVAEQLGVKAIALMGPAPFGFPSRPKTIILERHLACRPCSKHGQGPCRNSHFHQCLKDISVAEVRGHILKALGEQ